MHSWIVKLDLRLQSGAAERVEHPANSNMTSTQIDTEERLACLRRNFARQLKRAPYPSTNTQGKLFKICTTLIDNGNQPSTLHHIIAKPSLDNFLQWGSGKNKYNVLQVCGENAEQEPLYCIRETVYNMLKLIKVRHQAALANRRAPLAADGFSVFMHSAHIERDPEYYISCGELQRKYIKWCREERF